MTPSLIVAMALMSKPVSLTASTTVSMTSFVSIMKRVMGWRMMEYSAIRMGKGRKLHRQPLMGLTPSSA